MSAPAVQPATADQTAAPAAAPQTNEQKAKEFAEKHGLVAKIKKALMKKFKKAPMALAG